MTDFRLPTAAERRQHQQLQAEYIRAKAANDEALAIDRAAQTLVLATGNYCECWTDEVGNPDPDRRGEQQITDPNHSDEMCNEDFVRFCTATHAVRAAMGLLVDGPEWTADSKTRPALCAAADALLAWAAPLIADPQVRTDLSRAMRHPTIGPKMVKLLATSII